MEKKNNYLEKASYHLEKTIEYFTLAGINSPFDNYNYRTVMVGNIICKNNIFNNFKLNVGRTGRDAYADGYENIEMKTNQLGTLSITLNSLEMQFDKQNDNKRREETLEYDAFISSLFIKGRINPILILIFKSKDSISYINSRIYEEQEKFVEKYKESLTGDKRIRDNISLKPLKFLEHLKEEDVEILLYGKEISKKYFMDNIIGKRVENIEI